MVENIMRDMLFAVRVLRKSLGFTSVAVLTLAVGVGATVAIFSVVNGVVLKPLPYSAPEKLIAVRLSFLTTTGVTGVCRAPIILRFVSKVEHSRT